MDFLEDNWKQSILAVTTVVIGMVAYKAINKWFGIEQKLPNNTMKKAS